MVRLSMEVARLEMPTDYKPIKREDDKVTLDPNSIAITEF